MNYLTYFVEKIQVRLGIFGKLLFLIGQAQTKSKSKNKGGVLGYESKEEYFIKNGGILLEKQIALRQGRDIGAVLVKCFSEDELKNATNNYDPDFIVGRNRESVVYKATLDDRIVAIMSPLDRGTNPELTDVYLTDMSIRMVIGHSNMIKIYGCCLETCTPMVVSEFYPNKDLYQYLHGDMALRRLLQWSGRLRVATEIAHALSYMHNAFLKPVVHRDITPCGILLDSSFHAKLGNLGYAVSITPGETDHRWPVHGTLGYIDPEYIKTQEVTDKCDVYNFGVLMLELLTARDPVEMAGCGKDLVDEFVSKNKTIGINEMIDKDVLEEGHMDEIQWFVRLALTCVAKKGEERPAMASVVEELWQIQAQDNQQRVSNVYGFAEGNM